MDFLVWINSVTATIKLIEAWKKTRQSGIELEEALSEVDEEIISPEVVSDIVISQGLLEAFIQDINEAEKRFTTCINDPRYTPAQIDQEQEIATKKICIHLGKISNFNGGILPSQWLIQVSNSFQCEAL